MPIHDWTRVIAGTFHDFHVGWVPEIRTALNDGLLPSGYYAQAEQMTGPFGPDVLTLKSASPSTDTAIESPDEGGVAVALPPPRARWTARADTDHYVSRRRTVVIRHATDDRIVALIEIVSPGNKSSKKRMASFVEKATEALFRGYHLLIVDLFPPGRRDPNRIHSEIWESFSDEKFDFPAEEPVTLASYCAGSPKEVFVETAAIGQPLPDMALFLEPEFWVKVPLEQTYQAAYRGVPRKWKEVLEAP